MKYGLRKFHPCSEAKFLDVGSEATALRFCMKNCWLDVDVIVYRGIDVGHLSQMVKGARGRGRVCEGVFRCVDVFVN